MKRFRLPIEKLTARELKLYLLLLAALIIGGLTFGLIFRSCRSGGATSPRGLAVEGLNLQPEEERPLGPQDLMLPESRFTGIPGETLYYRHHRDQWSQKDIDEFWIDLYPLGRDYFRRRNRALMEELWEGVP